MVESCCVCMRRKRRRKADGSSTARGARHEERCSKVIILLSYNAGKLSLTLTDASGPTKRRGRAAAETKAPKCHAVPLRRCLLIFFPPSAHCDLSFFCATAWVCTCSCWFAMPCLHSNSSVDSGQRPSRSTTKKTSLCQSPVLSFLFYPFFALNFIVVTACQRCFVCILFFDLWHTVDHQFRSCHCPSSQMKRSCSTKFSFVAFLTFNFCVS